MLLTIDIGNTTTKLGVFNDDLLIERLVIPTIRGKSADEIRESIGHNLNHNLDAAIISSVVPELNDAVADLCRQHFNAPPTFVDHNFDFGFTIKCEPPDGVGIDRLVAAYAAVNKIKTPCIICDFGTATTIDAVNKNGEYLGGIITAGMNLLADALHQRTSKLPRIELRKPENAIGNSTVSAIQSGVYFGYIGLVDGLIKRISDELNAKPKIIATGGLAPLIAESSKYIKNVDPNLMLEGLRLIYEKEGKG